MYLKKIINNFAKSFNLKVTTGPESLSANFFYEQGMIQRDEGNDRDYEIGGRNIWLDKMRFSKSLLKQFKESHALHIKSKLSEAIRPERIFIHKGFYSETLKSDLPIKASIVHVDCNLYQSTCEVLWSLYRMNALQNGAVLLIDDWNCNQAHPNFGEQCVFKEFLDGQNTFIASEWYNYGYNRMTTRR